MKTKYNILITPIEDKPYTITLETDNYRMVNATICKK